MFWQHLIFKLVQTLKCVFSLSESLCHELSLLVNVSAIATLVLVKLWQPQQVITKDHHFKFKNIIYKFSWNGFTHSWKWRYVLIVNHTHSCAKPIWNHIQKTKPPNSQHRAISSALTWWDLTILHLQFYVDTTLDAPESIAKKNNFLSYGYFF